MAFGVIIAVTVACGHPLLPAISGWVQLSTKTQAVGIQRAKSPAHRPEARNHVIILAAAGDRYGSFSGVQPINSICPGISEP